MMTVSPIRMSFLSISSALWRLACLTVVPATTTGSKTATGVAAPVLPILITISLTIVVASSAGYLYAIAPLGFFPTEPKASNKILLLIFMTKPSVIY